MAVCLLAPGRDKRVRAGHPWVYRTEIAEVRGEFTPGDTVTVVDARGRFLGRGYINPRSQIAVRLVTRVDEPVDASLFRRRLEEALAYRQVVAPEAEACRLVFAESDRLPGLIVDRFGPYLVLQSLTLGMERWQETVVGLLVELTGVEGVYARNDVPVRELEGLEQNTGYLWGGFDPLVTIRENQVLLAVDLARGQKSGHFLDQRENRAALRPYVAGARVLDCFCHTGGFALHATIYGAGSVLGLDISETAVAQARHNATLNGLEDRCEFRVANVFDALREMDASGQRFDVIILDPPAFVKNRQALEGAIRGYKEINLRAMKLLPPGGFLFTASCSYHLAEELFQEVLAEAAADVRRTLRVIEIRHQARDHPVLLPYRESCYLKFFICQVL
ncbi:MAG: class I SAM-dependent rRNA methyltransferase [Clostridia bacterium]|nr:MAG: class I SAM-dependent rRNA methyltransferase [Clostridia bacterium]